jgi:epoxide hydrolase-like predicted phosphatase
MHIRAVIFDVGGVIVRTEDQAPREKWEKRLGLERRGLARAVFDSDASMRASIGKATVAEIWKSVGSSFQLDEAELAELQRDFWTGDRVDQEFVSFLRSLRPRYKTALLTNAWPDARLALQKRDLMGSVDDVIVSAEEGVVKPDPRIYRIAAERLGVRPEEAVFVDDVAENVEGARAVGMHGVQFNLGDYGSTAAFLRHLQEYIESQAS